MNPSTSRVTIGVLAGQAVYNQGLNQFLSAIFRGINVAARATDHHVLLGCGVNLSTGIRSAWPVVAPENAFVPIGPWNTDGLIVILPLNSPERAGYIHTLRHPLVFVGAGESGPTVAPDNAGGIQQAMAHLVEHHGHRRIAFLAGAEDDPGDSTERLSAYQQAVWQYGLPNDPGLVAYGHHYWQASLSAAQRLVRDGGDFTAVLASNDIAARAAIEILRNTGRRVPEDVAVIGFDDQADARGANPLLTTVHHPMFELGYHAVELLQQLLAGTATRDTVLRIPTRLVIRQSCGCSSASVRLAEQATAHPTEWALAELAQNMAEMVALETSYFQPAELRTWCDRLVQSWYKSVTNDHPAEFQQSLQQALQRSEELADDVHAWQAALSVLKEMPLMTSSGASPARRAAWLDAARVDVSERIRREYSYSVTHRWAVDDRVASLTARMLAVEHETALVRLLNEDFPAVGIRYLRALLFEADETDPVAWTSVLGATETDLVRRFSTRAFPAPGLYPPGTRLALGIVPLVFQDTEKQLGYVTFEMERLSQYPLFIAEHLTAALKTLWLYRDAAEGRRLAEEASRQKSRFLSTVSHELRTPLSLIIGLSEMLMLSTTPVMPEDLQQIYTSARHLGWLIRDVLDLASSQAGRLRLFHEPIQLLHALQPALATCRQLALDKGLAWQADLPEMDIWVLGDGARLSQVLLNLVSNAVKFTNQGSIHLAVEPGEHIITIRIQDTGIGIPPEAQTFIFDEFHQVEHARQHEYGGLGLGLAICKRLIEMHGGQIGVESSGVEGEGSTFSFSLPRLTPSMLAAPAGLPAPENDAQEEGNKTILVVDDDPGILKMHVRMLQTLGQNYRVLQAARGRDAIAMAQRETVHLVLLDLMMPEMDGFAVLEALRTGVSTRDIPVIVLTAQILSEADMARLSRGVISVLSKGVFTLNEILEHVQAVLSNRRKPGSEAQRLMRSAIAYIHTHYAEPISRESIAQYVGVSVGHLNRCFNQELHISPMTYLTRYRLNQAKDLLADSELSIADVAGQVGFVDVDYFGRVFRQDTGVSPGAYRRGKRKA